MNPGPASRFAAPPKPRLALLIATAGGLGYMPFAPGTFGSFAGTAIASLLIYVANASARSARISADRSIFSNFLVSESVVALVISIVGVWSASRVAEYLGKKDPQTVVVDEVSGQMITYLGLLAIGPMLHSWKYLLLGLILFRVFDIWKPFPARQAESLPGGWGIMADDWIAGIYAGIVLGIARSVFHI